VNGRFPVRVDPVPGEAIDSWLEATARSMDVTVGSIARIMELPATTRPLWISWLTRAQVDTIASAAGIPHSVVESMTLAVYDGVALKLDPITHRVSEAFPFSARGFSRFCPKCLSDSGGRWKLEWRLGWVFACARHNCLLADECPTCGEHQRRQQNYRAVPSPASCKCGQDLQALTMDLFPALHPIIRTQHRVRQMIDGTGAPFGVFEATPGSALDVLIALRSWANRVLNFASVEGLAAVAIAELPDSLANRVRDSRPLLARNALNERAPWRAVDTAVGVTAALHILAASTIADAGRRARPYVDGQNADTGAAELRSCARDGAIPAAIAIKASLPSMGPELQLRYRAVTTMPRAPRRTARRVRGIAARLPALMWTEWSDLLLPDLRKTIVARETLSWATLLADSASDTVSAAELLGQPVKRNALNQRLWVLRGSAYWDSICAALISLSDYLDDHGGPIDYQRRRHLDYSNVLSDDAWRWICAEAKDTTRHGTAAKARAYMVEVLTGCPTSTERAQRLRAGRQAPFRDPPAKVRVLLDEHARAFLKRQRIREPLTWLPPLNVLRDNGLPTIKSASDNPSAATSAAD
jgi:TniQ